MHVTRVSGVVNMVVPGQADITLHSIDRRRAQVFDYGVFRCRCSAKLG